MALSGTRYLEAHDLHVDRWGAELGWLAHRRLRLAVGHDDWSAHSSDPSFADVWPFTVWDIFTATRFRLESLDKDWRIDYAAAEWVLPAPPRLDLRLEGRFEWWGDGGVLFWKQRVPVLAPFFFRFEHFDDSLDWSPTHAVRLQLQMDWEFSERATLHLLGHSLIPLGDDRGSSAGGGPTEPGDPAPEETLWGALGLIARVSWSY